MTSGPLCSPAATCTRARPSPSRSPNEPVARTATIETTSSPAEPIQRRVRRPDRDRVPCPINRHLRLERTLARGRQINRRKPGRNRLRHTRQRERAHKHRNRSNPPQHSGDPTVSNAQTPNPGHCGVSTQPGQLQTSSPDQTRDMERTGLEPVTSGLQNPPQPVRYARVRRGFVQLDQARLDKNSAFGNFSGHLSSPELTTAVGPSRRPVPPRDRSAEPELRSPARRAPLVRQAQR